MKKEKYKILDQKRWNVYRITRNKILGIVAQMTANMIIPAPFAQNDKDEVDRMAAIEGGKITFEMPQVIITYFENKYERQAEVMAELIVRENE